MLYPDLLFRLRPDHATVARTAQVPAEGSQGAVGELSLPEVALVDSIVDSKLGLLEVRRALRTRAHGKRRRRSGNEQRRDDTENNSGKE